MPFEFSEQVDALAAAMAKAQATIHDIVKDREGYGYKYADISDVTAVVRPAAAANDIWFSQTSWMYGETVRCETWLIHSSGQWAVSRKEMPAETSRMKMTAEQNAGSAETYIRKRAAAEVFGLGVADVDVDSNEQPTPAATETVSIKQAGELARLINDAGISEKEFCQWSQIANVRDLAAVRFFPAKKYLEEKISESKTSGT